MLLPEKKIYLSCSVLMRINKFIFLKGHKLQIDDMMITKCKCITLLNIKCIMFQALFLMQAAEY